MTTSFATAEKFWPLTFNERGVLVPFTTPLLAAGRIRGTDLKPNFRSLAFAAT